MVITVKKKEKVGRHLSCINAFRAVMICPTGNFCNVALRAYPKARVREKFTTCSVKGAIERKASAKNKIGNEIGQMLMRRAQFANVVLRSVPSHQKSDGSSALAVGSCC